MCGQSRIYYTSAWKISQGTSYFSHNKRRELWSYTSDIRSPSIVLRFVYPHRSTPNRASHGPSAGSVACYPYATVSTQSASCVSKSGSVSCLSLVSTCAEMSRCSEGFQTVLVVAFTGAKIWFIGSPEEAQVYRVQKLRWVLRRRKNVIGESGTYL